MVVLGLAVLRLRLNIALGRMLMTGRPVIHVLHLAMHATAGRRAQHGGRHRAPHGEQHGEQYQEQDAEELHEDGWKGVGWIPSIEQAIRLS